MIPCNPSLRRSYLIGRKLFDPSLDTKALTQEFVEGFYSKAAAPHVLAYLTTMDAALRARGEYLGC